MTNTTTAGIDLDLAQLDKLEALVREYGNTPILGIGRGRSDILAEIKELARRSTSGSAIPPGFALVPEAANADEIVSRLYRRFKDWSARGFTAEDVTWCEVKADVLAMIAETASGSDGTTIRNIREFGAVCDGVTDDTVAFQRAVDWAASGSDGTAAAGLPPLPNTTLETKLAGYTVPVYGAQHMRDYGLACIAIGRGAAVRDYISPTATSGSELAPAQQAATCQPLADERAPVLAWAVESNIGGGLRAITKLTTIEEDADRYANAEQAKYAGCKRRKIALCDQAATAHQSPSIDQQGGAPAKPTYQAQFDGERGTSVWHDVTESAYHTFIPEHRRVLYAAPSPSAEDEREMVVIGGKRMGRTYLANLARDAARYRWMRDRNNSLETHQYDKGTLNGPSCYHEVEGIREIKSGADLDGAIDAAMSQAKGAGKEGDA